MNSRSCASPPRPIHHRFSVFLALLLGTLLFGTLCGVDSASAQIAGEYRSVASGNWNVLATWQTFNGTAWVAAATAPSSPSQTITIRSPHVVTITASVGYDQLVVDAGAQVTIAAGVASSLTNGPGNDLRINGTWLNQGGIWTDTGNWIVGAGGTFIHNTTSDIATPFALAALDPASTFIYRGSSTLAPVPSTSGRTYGNLRFESTAGTWTANASGAGTLTVNGDFVIGTGVTYSTTQTGTMTFAGNLTNNGTLTNGAGTQIYTFTGFLKLINGANAISFETLNLNSGAFTSAQTPVTIAAGFIGTIGANASLTAFSPFTNSGTLNVNGELSFFSFVTIAGNAFVYGAASSLTITTSAAHAVNNGDPYWPASGPNSVLFQGAGSVTMNVARTIPGLFRTFSAVTNANNLTVNGGIQVYSGGSLSGAPTYGPLSDLEYATGGPHPCGGEWSATAGPGCPNGVRLASNTTLDLGNAGAGTARRCAGTLQIDAGSTLSLNVTPMTAVLTVTGALTNNGTLALSSSGGGDLVLKSGFTNNGTFTASGRRVTFDGGVAQLIAGSSPTIFDALTINTTSLTQTSPVTINQDLALTNGPVLVDASTVLTVAPAGTVTRTNGFVSGKLRKTVVISGGAGSRTFEVGSVGPNLYAPVDVATTTAASDFEVTASTTAADHASIATSTIEPSKSVNRTWTLMTPSLNAADVAATFHFDPADVDAGANTSIFEVAKFDAPNWTLTAAGTRTATSTQATGITSFSDFQVGEPLSGTGVPELPAATMFTLSPVMPNPARGAMSVSFTVPVSGPVRVSVIDVAGREVSVLTSGNYLAGRHAVSWSGDAALGKVASGTYFVRCQSGGRQVVQRFTLLRPATP